MPIQVKNLTHVYSEGMPYQTQALTDISFEIADGSFVGIIGHTGSGKSTLIQHLNGLLKPKSGSIVVDGVDIADPGTPLREIRKTIGLVFQYPEYQLFEETVEKDIAFGPLNLGLSDEIVKERVVEALELVGLSYEEIGQRSPFDLSGGQKRRVAIAGVLAMQPRVLILDEPTAGLDPKAHKDILRLIQTVHCQTNNTILLVSHNMEDIATLSEQILVLDKGKLLMRGTPREVFVQTELLQSTGLALPPAAKLISMLRERGHDLPGKALTIDEAEKEIIDWLDSRKEK